MKSGTQPQGPCGTERGGKARPDSLPISPRCVLFNPDGCCLYGGFQDSLRVYGWEPERCFDVVPVNWGKVADLSICHSQLVSLCSRGAGRQLPGTR